MYLDMKHTCNPALADLDTALALAFPVSLPAFPPAYKKQQPLHQTTKKILYPTKINLNTNLYAKIICTNFRNQ